MKEENIYSNMFDDNNADSKKLFNWLTEKVLPSIRKSGSYKINDEKQQDLTNYYEKYKKYKRKYINAKRNLNKK